MGIIFMLVTVKVLNHYMGGVLNNYEINIIAITMGLVSIVHNLDVNEIIKKRILNFILYIFAILVLFQFGENLVNSYGVYLEVVIYGLGFIKLKKNNRRIC